MATLPFVIATVWGTYHLYAVAIAFGGRGNPLALTWLVAFLLLWWVVLAWFERPFTITRRQQRQLGALRVTVAIPVFNEPAHLLRQCIESLLDQTRRPNCIRVVDDGSVDEDYTDLRVWFFAAAEAAGVEATWKRTRNRGKRHAQMEVLAHDDADIYMTLDSDTILERRAVEEGLKPFAKPTVHSVAGMVAVWNSHGNWLARLTCMLYTPFTRGFRSAQSVLGRVMVNSGTLAFYRGATIRRYAGVYENEQFMGRPMQMNDDSMMTLYGLLAGKAVHQPTSVAFTIVPESFNQYRRQQMRWMRGTFVRSWWWMKYFSLRDTTFWMPVLELSGIALSCVMIPLVLINDKLVGSRVDFAIAAGLVALLLNYTIGLRYFIIRRSDESLAHQLGIFLLAPVAGLWRLLILRPMMLYSYLTFWKVQSWGTRGDADDDIDDNAGVTAVYPLFQPGQTRGGDRVLASIR